VDSCIHPLEQAISLDSRFFS